MLCVRPIYWDTHETCADKQYVLRHSQLLISGEAILDFEVRVWWGVSDFQGKLPTGNWEIPTSQFKWWAPWESLCYVTFELTFCIYLGSGVHHVVAQSQQLQQSGTNKPESTFKEGPFSCVKVPHEKRDVESRCDLILHTAALNVQI